MGILRETSFSFLGPKIAGKVRDIYGQGDKLILITTDRHSSFDRIIAHIPWKGQVLNQISARWFENTKDIVPNHILATPDPNVTVARKCKLVPVEAVVRGYLTGVTDTAIWTRYSKGQRNIGGIALPEGMKKNQKLPQPLFDPTTKEAVHDRALDAGANDRRRFCDARLVRSDQADGAGAVCARSGHCRAPRLDPGRYQIRIRHRRKRRIGVDRRDPYAGLVALLAARFLCDALQCRGGAGIFRQGILAAVVHQELRSLCRREIARCSGRTSYRNCRAVISRCTKRSQAKNFNTARRRFCRASSEI